MSGSRQSFAAAFPQPVDDEHLAELNESIRQRYWEVFSADDDDEAKEVEIINNTDTGNSTRSDDDGNTFRLTNAVWATEGSLTFLSNNTELI